MRPAVMVATTPGVMALKQVLLMLSTAMVATSASATTCSWVENTDYYGPNAGHGGVNLTRQECCDLCTQTKGCDFAVFGSPAESPPCSCWFKSGLATKNRWGYRLGATTCCPSTMAGGCPQGKPPKKVMLWMANPFPEPSKNQTVQTFIDGLKPHRMAFTGLAYQYFAICGDGSNDPGGGNDCKPEDATGTPHLAPGHPTQTPADLGAQLTAGLGRGYAGSPLELWPTISYGNKGNATVLNALLNDDAAIDKFIADAIAIAHKQRLTGFNWDLEPTGTPTMDRAKLAPFLQKLGAALHAATPPVLVSYDAGNTPVDGVKDMDRWISMGTYTGSTPAYLLGLAEGVRTSGSKFGVGLCPVCQTLSRGDTQLRFDAIDKYNGTIREIDLWAADYTVPATPQWEYYWPLLEKWLQTP